MKAEIFEYKLYKTYINDQLDHRADLGRGSRSALAQKLNCQTAYVSQVLNSSAHFSLEQAHAVNQFLGHTDEEGDFLLLLVQYERAGTPGLRAYFGGKLAQIQKRRLDLQQRLKPKRVLGPEEQAVYYSGWIYAAIHMLITVPEYRTPEALSSYLGTPVVRVKEVLEFLIQVGLVRRERGAYSVGSSVIHVGASSPHVGQHHTHWRLKALQSIDQRLEGDLHFSSLYTLSIKDAKKLEKMCVEFISKVTDVVKQSPEEDLRVFTLDLFSLRGKENKV